MIKKEKTCLIIYFSMIVVCSLVHVSIFQNILLIIISFVLNLAMTYKLDIKSNKYEYISFGIIAINIVLIFLKYYNSIDIGFPDGLPYGQIGYNLYYDSYGYYYQGIKLGDLWLNGGFKDWILGNIPKNYVERGIYNYFVIFNAVVRVLFGKDLITWMIIKYQFSIIAIALLYKIANNFVKERYSLIALIIFNFYPGYLLVNGDLMRDNFISFFTILTMYIIIQSLNSKKVQWIKIIFLLSVITYLRVYMGIVLGISLFIYLFFDKLNIRKIVLYSIVLILIILIVGKVMQFWGYGFLGLELLQSGDIEQIQWNSQSIDTPVKLFVRSLYLIFTGGRATISDNYILELYNSCAPIFIAMFSLPTFFSLFFFKILNKKQRKFVMFSFVYTLFSGIMITYGFSSIVPRLYICWFWSQCIVFVILISNISKLQNNQKQLLKIAYMFYILIVLGSIKNITSQFF